MHVPSFVRLLKVSAATLLIVFLAGCEAERPLSTRVTVSEGTLRGENGRDPAVRVFRGIPYAAPPIDSLRWRPPQPPTGWEGERDATEFAATCMQVLPPEGSFYQIEFFPEVEPMSEDCLYLNVWTAAESPSAQLPVMVWIHGGAFIQGSGSMPSFDGEGLAKKDVVVVTINYRLGVFGLLAHPDLTEEADYAASGNYGILDQIAALQWVQENIAAFGGDPGNVTIFGQSAGAASINVLLASPLARGLFHRAILQSGSAYAFGRSTPLPEAEQSGVEFAETAGAASIRELRRLSTDSLLAVSRSVPTSVNVDGWLIPEPVDVIMERGNQHDVSILAGSTADEGTAIVGPDLTASRFRELTRQNYGEDADSYLALYPATSDEQAQESFNASFSNRLAWGAEKLAEVHTRTGSRDAYLYLLSHEPPGRDQDRYGAFHSSDLVYVFSSLHAVDRPWQPADSALAEVVSSYWANFAATGDPNGGDLPPWPAYDPEQRQAMELGDYVGPRRLLSPDIQQFLDDRWMQQQ